MRTGVEQGRWRGCSLQGLHLEHVSRCCCCLYIHPVLALTELCGQVHGHLQEDGQQDSPEGFHAGFHTAWWLPYWTDLSTGSEAKTELGLCINHFYDLCSQLPHKQLFQEKRFI